jgi:hypothetical protein
MLVARDKLTQDMDDAVNTAWIFFSRSIVVTALSDRYAIVVITPATVGESANQ